MEKEIEERIRREVEIELRTKYIVLTKEQLARHEANLLDSHSQNAESASECDCCGWDDYGYQHEPHCSAYRERLTTTTPHREEHTEWDVVEQIGIASFGGIAFKPTQEYREKIMKIIDSLLKDQRERIREEIEKTDAMETVDSARLTSYTVIDETTRTKWVKIDTILNLPSFKD